jgi:hypothetical protein
MGYGLWVMGFGLWVMGCFCYEKKSIDKGFERQK